MQINCAAECIVGKNAQIFLPSGVLRLVGSIKLKVSVAKEPYKRDYILPKRPII